MWFTPHYTVSYKGRFYRSGVEFEIDDRDADLMSMHGRIKSKTPSEVATAPQAVSAPAEAEKAVRKGGRPRKQ